MYLWILCALPNVCVCVCVSQWETHFTISPIIVKVFSAFKPEVQEPFSHHPQLITFALPLSCCVCIPLFLLCAQLVENNMGWHILHPPKLNWTEMIWTILKKLHIAIDWLDILNELVLNGPFWCLVDVDKTVCAKTSVNVALKEQLRQWDGTCSHQLLLLLSFCETKTYISVWNEVIFWKSCAHLGWHGVWLHDCWAQSSTICEKSICVDFWLVPATVYCTDERQRQGKNLCLLALCCFFFFFKMEVHLRRARTCTPEDALFNINSMYLWYPLLILAWGGLHTVYPTSCVTSLTKTSVKSYTRTGCHLFGRYTLRKRLHSCILILIHL